MRIVIVSKKFDNKKLISFLEAEFPFANSSTFYKALRKKDIRINDIKISENTVIHEGDKIKLYIIDSFLFPTYFDIPCIYEDENILIVNKPKGIEVNNCQISLASILQDKYSNKFIMPCHRLDRNTSGLVLFAKNSASFEILLEKFKTHEIKKFYKCKVLGTFDKKHGILKAYLFKDTKKSMVYISQNPEKGYKEIITEYTVISENTAENYSILEVILHTRSYPSDPCSFVSYRSPNNRRSVNMA